MTARILIIAGSDSGGGAGIQADIRTVTMLGGHAMTAITAITAQNTLGVEAIYKLPPKLVVQQMASVVEDIGVDAIKIGMMGGPEIANAIADELASGLYGVPIVFDPVMISTSGAALADDTTIAVMERLASLSTVVTPNLPELAVLCASDTLSREREGEEASALAERFGTHVLVKGGHGPGNKLSDTLYDSAGMATHWKGDRIDSTSTHGTGCTLASAIACGLGQGKPLIDAIATARLFVRHALRDAPCLGGGHGPMGHHVVRLDCGPAMRLNQVTVNCSDYEVSKAFYEKLGLLLIVDSPEDGYARFEAPGGATLSIHRDEAHGIGGTTVYFECDDLDAEVGRLKARGFAFASDPKDQEWLWREAELFDPFGNRILLYHAGENRRYPPWRA